MRILITALFLATLFNQIGFAQQIEGIPPYVRSSHSLHDTIASLDSLWEDSYNNCKLDVQENIISDDLEFYHDLGGLLTSKTKLLEALKNNICGNGFNDAASVEKIANRILYNNIFGRGYL